VQYVSKLNCKNVRVWVQVDQSSFKTFLSASNCHAVMLDCTFVRIRHSGDHREYRSKLLIIVSSTSDEATNGISRLIEVVTSIHEATVEIYRVWRSKFDSSILKIEPNRDQILHSFCLLPIDR
jgi:hypothetical protein